MDNVKVNLPKRFNCIYMYSRSTHNINDVFEPFVFRGTGSKPAGYGALIFQAEPAERLLTQRPAELYHLTLQ